MCCCACLPLQFGPRLTGDVVEAIGARDVAELVAVSSTGVKPAHAVMPCVGSAVKTTCTHIYSGDRWPVCWTPALSA
jgi:hypothetical protein